MKNFTLLLIVLFSSILATCWEKIDENAVDKGGGDTTVNVEGDVTDSTINVNSDSEGDSANGTSSTGDTSLDVPVSVEGEVEKVDHEYVLKMIDFGTSPEIELDSSGNAIISYLGTDSSVKVGKATSTVVDGKVNLDISVAIVDSSGIAGSPSLVVDSNNKWGVAYTQSEGTEIKYSTSDNFENIESYIVGSNLNPNYFKSKLVAKSDNNSIPVVGYNYGSSKDDSRVKFASFENNKFNVITTELVPSTSPDDVPQLLEFTINSSNYKGVLLVTTIDSMFYYCLYIENALGFSQDQCFFGLSSNVGLYKITYSDSKYHLLHRNIYVGGALSELGQLFYRTSDDDSIHPILSSAVEADGMYVPGNIQIYDSKPIVIGGGDTDGSIAVGLQLARLISDENWLFTTFNELNSQEINSIDFAITQDGKVKIVFEVNSEASDNKVGYVEYKL